MLNMDTKRYVYIKINIIKISFKMCTIYNLYFILINLINKIQNCYKNK